MQHQPNANYGLAAGPFNHPTYRLIRPFWSFFGRKFHVYAPDGTMVMFVKHPIFRLRQEFTMFSDESETRAMLVIKQRQILALNVAHDVFDAASGERVGTLRSRGLKSIVRDTWDILDPSDQPVGLVEEEGASWLRRFIPLLLGKWKIELGGQRVSEVRQIFRFFTKEFELDLSANHGRMDPRFALACALLALMAESQREDRG